MNTIEEYEKTIGGHLKAMVEDIGVVALNAGVGLSGPFEQLTNYQL